jgi:lysophospholipase L1-like esterase
VSQTGPATRSAAALALLFLITISSACVVPAAAKAQARAYYVSLGDSLARGWQPSSSGHSRPTKHGYVDVVASALRRAHPGLATMKLGCPGETTTTMLAGGRCHYGAGSQLAAAEAFLKAHRRKVVAISVNIGDNDVEQCMVHSHIDGACVRRELAVVRKRLPRIAAHLRARADKNVPIVGLTDYDQFLAYWLSGPAGRRLARRSVRIVVHLNRVVDAIYRRAGVRAADATAAFATTHLSHFVSLRGHGRVPLAVARVCRWTWACSGPPIGFNDHANSKGYRVLGRVVLAGLRAPH